MKLVTVAVFNSPAEAEALHARLKSAGIEANLRPESEVEHSKEFSRPRAGMRVEVARGDFEAALKMVYDWNSTSDAKPPSLSAPLFESTPLGTRIHPDVAP